MRYPLLTFTIYQQILNHSVANTTGNQKIEFCMVMMSHQCKMKTNILSAGSIMMILLIKNGCNVHHVTSGSMNLAVR